MDNDIRKLLGKRILFMDGGMGTRLETLGAKPGEHTVLWNVLKPELIKQVHKEFLEAGSDVILANTFGASDFKLKGTGYEPSDIVKAGIGVARDAVREVCGDEREGFVALDLSSTGRLLKPLGDLDFDECYDSFRTMAIAGEEAGADLAVIETMTDTLELKCAVLAVKENTGLPVFCSVSFDERGKLMTGADVEAVVTLLEGLGADVIGINCSLGPAQLRPHVKEMLRLTSLPVMIQPNAGLPRRVDGKTVYDVGADEFASIVKEFAEEGAWIIGGCCGTTAEYIRKLHDACCGIEPRPIEKKHITRISSYTHAVNFDHHVVIGERINPTGKKRFKQALRDMDLDYVLQEGFNQEDAGAEVLDVNVGLPEIDEKSVMLKVMTEIQSVIDLPLQIDTASPETLERALRYYNGKAMVNSVNGKAESMEKVFPLVRKYGGVVVGLTLDEAGIPDTADGRLEIARKIVNTAESYGIGREDIVIDCLTLAASADNTQPQVTLDAIRKVKAELGVKTILGVSNVSFGLPKRQLVTDTFYSMALEAGLDTAIINPMVARPVRDEAAFRLLTGEDKDCADYILKYSEEKDAPAAPKMQPKEGGGADPAEGLKNAVSRGLKDQAAAFTSELLADKDPIEIINSSLIPALNSVGKGFEEGRVFLPQLLMAAEAAKKSFDLIKDKLSVTGSEQASGTKIVIATVKGDIHDIGKNIVKVLLENYGYKVYDLGRDVDPEDIVNKARETGAELVGLSALMTTTVGAMEDTIRLLRKELPECKVMVGGAVLTQVYADMIGADSYVKDAMASVYYAGSLSKTDIEK